MVQQRQRKAFPTEAGRVRVVPRFSYSIQNKRVVRYVTEYREISVALATDETHNAAPTRPHVCA